MRDMLYNYFVDDAFKAPQKFVGGQMHLSQALSLTGLILMVIQH
jgi:hypothetical protein